jgi:hypothetical protein
LNSDWEEWKRTLLIVTLGGVILLIAISLLGDPSALTM